MTWRWVGTTMLVAVAAALHLGCNRHGNPALRDQAGRPLADAAAADMSRDEGCAIVATVLTARLAGHAGGTLLDAAAVRSVPEGPLVVAAQLSSPGSAARPLFPGPHRCSDRLTIVPEASGGAATFTLTVRRTADETLLFAVSGAGEAASGQLVKDERGEWIVQGPGANQKQPRTLDAAPVEGTLATPLPAGVAEARFEVDTGADIMGANARQSGLVVVVRFGAREVRQTIASCDEVTRGNALGEVAGRILDIASCGALFRLVHQGHAIVVEREPADGGARAVIATVKLPPTIRKVVQNLPPERN